MVRDSPHWVAGPIAYKTTDQGVYPDRTIEVCKWEFIGGTAAGELRRWHLCFSIETRKFTTKRMSVNNWDKAHAQELRDFYLPVSVLRSMLPKGSITVTLKAMLPAQYIAEVTAIALRGGKMDA